MQRDESLLSLSTHWGLIIKIFLFLCQMEAREQQQGFGKVRTGSRALFGTCAQLRKAILHVKRYQLLDHFFWACDPRFIELYEHPNNLCNFFELNSRLNWLTSYLNGSPVTENDIFCLSGNTNLIQRVLDSRAIKQFSPELIRRYCLLIAMSERSAALTFFCEGMRMPVQALIPEVVEIVGNYWVKKSKRDQLKESFLYELCLHGNEAAWSCVATLVTAKALRDFISTSGILDILISDDNERQPMRSYSLRAMLKYCDLLQNKVGITHLRDRLMRYNCLDLACVLLELAKANTSWGKVDSSTLRTIVKSGHLALTKKILMLNPDLLQRLKNPRDALGYSMVAATLESEESNHAMLTYLLDELQIPVGCEFDHDTNMMTAIYKQTEMLTLLLSRAPNLVHRKSHDQESPLQRILKRSLFLKHQTGSAPWKDRCFANVIALVNAGANPADAFNLSLGPQKGSHLGFLALHEWPMFNEAVICLIRAGLNLDEKGASRYPASYYLLLCHDYLSEASLTLLLAQSFNRNESFQRGYINDAFNRGCATRSAALIGLLIDNGAELKSDPIDQRVELTFRATDKAAELRYKQFCHELKIEGNRGVAGMTGLDLAIIHARSDVVRVIVKKIPRDAVVAVLTSQHLNNRKTTYELAVALNHQEIIHTIDCLLESTQTLSFSAGISRSCE